jgi:hypothetical protein
MSILKKAGEIFGSLIFALAFGFLILFIALANFTKYDTVQPLITNEIESQLIGNVQQNQLELLYLNLTDQCKSTSRAVVPLGDDNQAYLQCEDIKHSNSTEIPHLIALNIFNQTYYKHYDCSFLDCVRDIIFSKNSTANENQNMQIILSSTANEFFTSNQIFVEIATIIGIIIIIFSVRVWYNILKIIGITLLVVGITYLFIPIIKTEISATAQSHNIPNQILVSIVDTLFSPITTILKASLIIGIIFTVTGYLTSYLMQKPKSNQPI